MNERQGQFHIPWQLMIVNANSQISSMTFIRMQRFVLDGHLLISIVIGHHLRRTIYQDMHIYMYIYIYTRYVFVSIYFWYIHEHMY